MSQPNPPISSAGLEEELYEAMVSAMATLPAGERVMFVFPLTENCSLEHLPPDRVQLSKTGTLAAVRLPHHP